MIITIDGYDGTGKTTLSKKLAEQYDFIYLDKPFIKKYQIEHNCSYEQAIYRTRFIEKNYFQKAIV